MSPDQNEVKEKVAEVGTDNTPEWATMLIGEMAKMEEKLNLLDNIKKSVETLCSKVEVLETKVEELEKNT